MKPSRQDWEATPDSWKGDLGRIGELKHDCEGKAYKTHFTQKRGFVACFLWIGMTSYTCPGIAHRWIRHINTQYSYFHCFKYFWTYTNTGIVGLKEWTLCCLLHNWTSWWHTIQGEGKSPCDLWPWSGSVEETGLNTLHHLQPHFLCSGSFHWTCFIFVYLWSPPGQLTTPLSELDLAVFMEPLTKIPP